MPRDAATTPKIELVGLRKRFGANQVLDGVSLKVMPGESLVIIGGSGTGKSVTLKCQRRHLRGARSRAGRSGRVHARLAWACFQCNRYKGSEVGAYDAITGQLVPLLNPRKQNWHDHFSLESGEIVASTDVGRVSILILQLNRPE